MVARIREVQNAPDGYLDLWARDHRKAVATHEPVPTPNGWTTHGKLKPGDFVYGADGKPTQVVACGPVTIRGKCYRVTFDDGASVVVSAEHLWTIEQRTRRRVSGTNQRIRERITIDTEALAARLHPTRPVCIQMAKPLDGPDIPLPVDPYLLGAWLGDGTSDGARFTSSSEDYPHWEREFGAHGLPLKVYCDRGTCKQFSIASRGKGLGKPRAGLGPFGDALRAAGVSKTNTSRIFISRHRPHSG